MSKNIYIICPPKKATGGPEALHQLGYILNSLGYNAKMLYSKYKKDPVHSFYKNYNVPYVMNVKDSIDNVMIIPESMTNLIAKYPLAAKKIWWLSLDFYEVLMNSREKKKNWIRKLIVPYKHTEYRFEPNKTVTHWYQSQRTKEFLQTKKLDNEIAYLCDYVTELFFDDLPESFQKENIITYNPKKGLDKIEKYKALLPQYKWTPLSGMSREEMRDTLRKAKLHIDFGYFPGRDKIPREALVSGVCLLTGRDGTSAFKEDLGIPEKYKLHTDEMQPEKVIELINHTMNNYEVVFGEFLDFRSFVLNEKQNMIENAKKLVTNL
ncbi:hypothetical protein GKZ90_0009670 [Flavobacterium sp. MC2016-06]|jgi:hypothetical protein|uniref:hypothetical protein n=1 Tax=Flavobacterium sp. MC2016-06 TaxID=2676308 RepID=UPI0012BA5F02|nr:hypothetical protein [Flavobacterium sp. MC2016-06]MBU3859813.1 hypothetical protein [Flavobacterium sp. MC2016-06]